MQRHHTLFAALVGAGLTAAACGGGAPEAGGEAAAAQSTASQPQAAPAPECYLARGTMDEAGARPSPLRQTMLTFAQGEARLCYGAPSARGREVIGGLVPMGQLWRTGANEATALHSSFPLNVGGVALEAGSHSLYTRPGEGSWEVVLNGAVERWGIPISAEVQQTELGSFSVTPQATEAMVETLTFRWEPMGEREGHLVMEWENTRLRIPVSAGL